MGSTDLALSWKDHHGVLFNVFEKLLAKKSLVDCTLAAEGKFLKAHRIVLSACSPYFEALLDQEYDKHPIIFLRDVQFEDLKTLLEFVYSGEIKIPENRLVEFLNVAEALQIKGLGGVGNEGQVSKSSADSLPRKETRSPVPRKRSRRHSSSSDGSSRDRAEIIPVNAESSRPKSGSENIVPVTNNASVSQPVPHQSSVVPSEDLNPNVKVKQEIITPVQSTCADQLASDQSGENEEILGLKPEFEQVTFTEDYSDDMLPEDSDSVDHVIDQDQPSSSQQYSGFSAESVKPGELSIHPPFAVGGVNQPVPEENLKTYIDKKCEDLLTLINKNKRSFLYDLQKVREEFLLRHEKFELSETLQEFSFPISDITEFKRYDSMIVERKTLRNELIFSMANQCLGITDYKEAIRRILKNIMSKSVQIKYCASGRAMKEEKENFSATKIFECLKSAATLPARAPWYVVHGSAAGSEELSGAEKEMWAATQARVAAAKEAEMLAAAEAEERRRRRRRPSTKAHSCTLCRKQFMYPTQLVRHMRVHTGEKPFECEVCRLTFTESGNLQKHMRVHTDERPFQCPYCLKTFRQKAHLQGHVVTHTGERPFVCKDCGRTFIHTRNLRVHRQTHHPELAAQDPKYDPSLDV